MEYNMQWTDGGNKDFIAFNDILEEYFNNLVGGEENRKSFIPYNSLDEIHDVIIVYSGGEAIACGSFRRYDDTSAEVKRVYVREGYRGNGIAKRIMKGLEDRARQKGYKKIILQTREVCVEAIGLYKHMGYRLINNYPPYKDKPLAVCFEKELDK